MDAAGHRPFHLLPEQLHLVYVHALLDQGPLVEQLPQVVLVHRPLDLQIHLELPLGLLVVAHGIHQQITQRATGEKLPKHVEHLVAEGCSGDLQLVE